MDTTVSTWILPRFPDSRTPTAGYEFTAPPPRLRSSAPDRSTPARATPPRHGSLTPVNGASASSYVVISLSTTHTRRARPGSRAIACRPPAPLLAAAPRPSLSGAARCSATTLQRLPCRAYDGARGGRCAAHRCDMSRGVDAGGGNGVQRN